MNVVCKKRPWSLKLKVVVLRQESEEETDESEALNCKLSGGGRN